MGNGCACYRDLCIQEVKKDTFVKIENNQIQIQVTNLYEMAKYFEEVENEVYKKNEKKKLRKLLSHKKLKNLNTVYNTISKYELMLRRLLEQKNIKRKGPKRRETIRINNNENFILLVRKAIEDNKNIEKNKENDLGRKESILLNNKGKANSTYLTSGKHSLIINKFSKKKILDGLGDINMDNEIKPTCGNISNIKNNEE